MTSKTDDLAREAVSCNAGLGGRSFYALQKSKFGLFICSDCKITAANPGQTHSLDRQFEDQVMRRRVYIRGIAKSIYLRHIRIA